MRRWPNCLRQCTWAYGPQPLSRSATTSASTCLRSPPRPVQHCRLTGRSTGRVTAWHLARAALSVIIRRAGQAPRRVAPVNSALGVRLRASAVTRPRHRRAVPPRRLSPVPLPGADSTSRRSSAPTALARLPWYSGAQSLACQRGLQASLSWVPPPPLRSGYPPIRSWFSLAGSRPGRPGLSVTAVPSLTAPPNPALNRTANIKAPWPRSAQVYHAPRGQGALLSSAG